MRPICKSEYCSRNTGLEDLSRVRPALTIERSPAWRPPSMYPAVSTLGLVFSVYLFQLTFLSGYVQADDLTLFRSIDRFHLLSVPV